MSDKVYKVLFWPDINYEPGHWRPVMAMANKLKETMAKDNMECHIKFICTPECKPIIQSVIGRNGKRLFDNNEIITVLKDLFPLGSSSLASEQPETARSRIDHCLKIADGEFDKALEDFKPDLLVAGFFVSMEALLIKYRYNERIRNKISDPEMQIMITTTYLRHPSEDPAITSLRFLAHHSQEQSSRLMQAATGEDKFNGSFSSIQEFIEPLEDVVEMITCPKELDHDYFNHPKENISVHYVEPCILDTGRPLNLYYLIKRKNLIYASAGSRVRDYIEGAKDMFRVLKEMLGENGESNRIVCMAVGYTLKEELLREEFVNSDRIQIIDWADQTAILKMARAAVIHGGLASIKECIFYGIAPIVVPLGKDQMDNALRVVNKEVGSMIMLDNLSGANLSSAILSAEKNADIRNSMLKMKEIFERYEKEAFSISLIKRVLGIGIMQEV